MNFKLLLILAGILVFGVGNARNTYAAPPSSGCALLTPAQIQKVLEHTGTTYTDTGLTNGTTYYYAVNANGSWGVSNFSNQVSATP